MSKEKEREKKTQQSEINTVCVALPWCLWKQVRIKAYSGNYGT